MQLKTFFAKNAVARTDVRPTNNNNINNNNTDFYDGWQHCTVVGLKTSEQYQQPSGRVSHSEILKQIT